MEKYTERLAKLLFYAIIAIALFYICRYFSSVLIYLAVAFVISLLSRPLMKAMGRIKIGKYTIPASVRAIVSILVILTFISGVIAGMTPVVSNVISEISSVSAGTNLSAISAPLADLNETLISTFGLEEGFRIEDAILAQTKSLLNINIFGNIIGSVASTLMNIFIGLFSVVFISFFFIKDETLMHKMAVAVAPARFKEKMSVAVLDCEVLLSRYFVGLMLEMLIVGIIDFTGLWAIARLNFETALGIAFIAGVLNIIPYVGPLIGGLLGTIMGITFKYCSGGAIGLDVSFWAFLLILVCIFAVAQLVDNYLLQPIIYSTSIKATPLEIFIVMLMAATIGGIAGMLVCIPAYTVIRVIYRQVVAA